MKNILIVLMSIIMSLFFFSFEFTFLPGINTKMMLAVLGILLFVWHSLKSKKGVVISSEFFISLMIACCFSLVVFNSVTYNNTDDYAYTSYYISMLVWLFAAYAACWFVAQLHKDISIKLIINYLIGISVAQCIIALLIDNILAVQLFVDRIVVTHSEAMEEINRLYGIGAALDVAGTRFSAVLVMMALLLSHDNEIKSNKKQSAIYIFMFIVIAVVGSMIARTTNIGLIMALGYIFYSSGLWKIRIKITTLRQWGVLIGVSFILIVVCVYLYNNMPAAHKLLRFAFEAPINWIETGEWRTDSTDQLKSMWILPESIKTWIIGDGYFMNPIKPGFYMGTDIGYLRFIFYCGLPGLLMFSVFFVYLSVALYRRFPQERNLFFLLLILTFVIWMKVSTDIFLVYALFMCIPMLQKQKNNQMMNRL